MALYFYQAFSKEGKKVTGYVDAPSPQTVREQLSKQGMYPISITAAAQEQIPWWRRLFSRGVSQKDLILFTRQLSVLLKSGVPLLQSIELLSDQFTGPTRTMLVKIKDDLKEGQAFADALKKYPKVFDNIYVQLVRAGEATGKLESVLERLTAFIERQIVIKKKVKSATRMPMIQLGIALLVVIGLLVKVVPEIAGAFVGMGEKLPWPTRFLMDVSGFVSSYYIFILIFIISVVGGIMYWKSTPSGAKTLDALKLRLPLIGYFTRINAVVQFSSTLGILIESGVNLAEALDIVVNIIDNKILANALKEARDKIIKQGKITQYLEQTKIFPPIAIYLIRTGEETGKLDYMLLTVARNYEEDLSEFTDNLTSLLGPVLLIVMALIVGFIVISIALPLAQMGTGIGEF